MITSESPKTGTARHRFGELTYSSFDDGVRGGGWQTKEHRGGLTTDEREWLRSKVAIQFDPGVELPRFPTPEQAAALPRRMVYAPAEHGGAGVWHTAPAGVDGSGRPGNVFAHVLLDRRPVQELTDLRPIDLWRSPDWLTPYGTDQVLAASLPPTERPRAGSAVSTSAVVRFLLDPEHFRLGVAAALLDACAAAVGGGPRVVLLTRTVDDAALWIGAVSHLMASVSARSLYFSTLERVGTLPAAWQQGIHLACVPLADREAFGRPDPSMIVIDEEESILIGDLGGAPHQTAVGNEIEVTEWSVMAQVVLADQRSGEWALEKLDDLVKRVGHQGNDLAWPLAMVISEAQDHFPDALGEASRVIASSSPDALGRQPELFDHARVLMDANLGETTEDAWSELSRLVVPGRPLTVMGELCFGVYVSRAFRDVTWLSQDDGVPLPDTPSYGEHYLAEATAAAGETLAGLDRPQVDDPHQGRDVAPLATLARLTELMVALKIVTAANRDRLEVALERQLLPSLFEDRQVGSILEGIGPLSEETQATVVRHLVSTHEALLQRPLGSRLRPEVLQWLYPEALPFGQASAADRGIGQRPDVAPMPPGQLEVRAELAFQRVLADGPGVWSRERPLALYAVMEQSARGIPIPVDLAVFFDGPPWEPRDLLEVERRYAPMITLGHLLPTFKAAPWDEFLADLTRLVMSTRFPAGVRDLPPEADALALVQARQISAGSWWHGKDAGLKSCVRQILAGGVIGLRLPDLEFAADVYDSLQAAYALAVVSGGYGREVTQLHAVLVADGRANVSETAAGMLKDSLKNITRLSELVTVVLLGDPKFPGPRPDRSYAGLDQLRVKKGGVRMPVLEAIVRTYLSTSSVPQETLTGMVHGSLGSLLGRNADDKVVRSCERFATARVRDLYPSESLIQRFRGRGHRD